MLTTCILELALGCHSLLPEGSAFQQVAFDTMALGFPLSQAKTVNTDVRFAQFPGTRNFHLVFATFWFAFPLFFVDR